MLAAICLALDSSVLHLVGAAHRELRELADSVAGEGQVLDLASRRAEQPERLQPAELPTRAERLADLGPAMLAA